MLLGEEAGKDVRLGSRCAVSQRCRTSEAGVMRPKRDGCLLDGLQIRCGWEWSEHQVMFEIVNACRIVENITILYYVGTFGTLEYFTMSTKIPQRSDRGCSSIKPSRQARYLIVEGNVMLQKVYSISKTPCHSKQFQEVHQNRGMNLMSTHLPVTCTY